MAIAKHAKRAKHKTSRRAQEALVVRRLIRVGTAEKDVDVVQGDDEAQVETTPHAPMGADSVEQVGEALRRAYAAETRPNLAEPHNRSDGGVGHRADTIEAAHVGTQAASERGVADGAVVITQQDAPNERLGRPFKRGVDRCEQRVEGAVANGNCESTRSAQPF